MHFVIPLLDGLISFSCSLIICNPLRCRSQRSLTKIDIFFMRLNNGIPWMDMVKIALKWLKPSLIFLN